MYFSVFFQSADNGVLPQMFANYVNSTKKGLKPAKILISLQKLTLKVTSNGNHTPLNCSSSYSRDNSHSNRPGPMPKCSVKMEQMRAAFLSCEGGIAKNGFEFPGIRASRFASFFIWKTEQVPAVTGRSPAYTGNEGVNRPGGMPSQCFRSQGGPGTQGHIRPQSEMSQAGGGMALRADSPARAPIYSLMIKR